MSASCIKGEKDEYTINETDPNLRIRSQKR